MFVRKFQKVTDGGTYVCSYLNLSENIDVYTYVYTYVYITYVYLEFAEDPVS